MFGLNLFHLKFNTVMKKNVLCSIVLSGEHKALVVLSACPADPHIFCARGVDVVLPEAETPGGHQLTTA